LGACQSHFRRSCGIFRYGVETPSGDIGAANELPPLDTPFYSEGMAWHVRSGAHGITLQDWQYYLDYLDRFLPAS
jgi:hypothetical protein